MTETTPALPSLDIGFLYQSDPEEAKRKVLPPFWDDALAAACGTGWNASGQEYLLRRMMREPTIFSTYRVFCALVTEGVHDVVGNVQKPVAGASLRDRQKFRRSEEALAFTRAWVERLAYPLKSLARDLCEAFPFGSKLAETELGGFSTDERPFRGNAYLAPVDVSPKPRTVYRWQVDHSNRVDGVRPEGGTDTTLVPAANLVWLSVGGMDRNPIGEPILAACYKSYHRKQEAENDESKTAKQSGFIVINQAHPPQGVTDNGYIKVKFPDGTEKDISKLQVSSEAMKGARRGMVASMPPGMTASMLQAGSFDFGSIIDRCDREIIAAFVGAARALKESQNGSKADTGEASGVAETLRDWARGLLSAAIERLFAIVLAMNFGDEYADVCPRYDITTEESEDLEAASNFLQGSFANLTVEQRNWLAAKIGMPPFPEEEEVDETQIIDATEQAKTAAEVFSFIKSFGDLTFASRVDAANGAASRRIDGAVRSADKSFRNLVSRLASGKLDEEGFVERFAYTLRVAHERAYGIGYEHGDGGDILSELGEEYVATVVTSEGSFARDLAAQLANGEISEVEGLRRATLYAGAVRSSANEGFRESSEVLKLKLDWTLGASDHCATCPRYAEMSPWEADELPTVPGGMDTECGRNCTCLLKREDGKEGFAREPAGASSDS